MLTLFKSNKLSLVEDLGNAIRSLALLFSILVPVLWVLALGLARGRRRTTLMSIGFSMVVAGVLGAAARKLLISGITNSLVNNAAQRPAVRATLGIGTSILAEIAVAFIIVGIVVVVAAWFAGPARIAVGARRAIAPFLREEPGWTYAIVAAVLVLIFIWQPIPATGTPVGIIVFSCLALLGTELLRRQTEREFPDAMPGDASAAIRARLAARRGAGRRGARRRFATRAARAAGEPARRRRDHASGIRYGQGDPAARLVRLTAEPEQVLRRLAAGDERLLGTVMAPTPEGAAGEPTVGALDRQTRALIRLAALLVLGAPTASVQWAVELASTAGAGVETLTGVLLAAAPAAGAAQVAESAPRLALALGFDLELE